jgi:hypothetical protein
MRRDRVDDTYLLIVLSNVGYAAVAVIAAKLRMPIVALVFLTTTVISAVYHVCDSRDVCATDFRTLYWLDHSISLASVTTICVAAVTDTETAAAVAAVTTFVVAYTAYVFTADPFLPLVVAVAACVAVGIAVRFARGVPTQCWRPIVVIVAAVGLAAAMFVFNGERVYWITHSVWHTATAVGSAAAIWFSQCVKNL